jgi:hypothetical protein
MTVAMAIIALGVAAVVAGGPTELLRMFEGGLRALGGALQQAWLTVMG